MALDYWSVRIWWPNLPANANIDRRPLVTRRKESITVVVGTDDSGAVRVREDDVVEPHTPSTTPKQRQQISSHSLTNSLVLTCPHWPRCHLRTSVQPASR